jgi:hypothetical protein
MAPHRYLAIAQQAAFPSFFQVVESNKVTMYYKETEVIIWWLVVEMCFLKIFFCQKCLKAVWFKRSNLALALKYLGPLETSIQILTLR